MLFFLIPYFLINLVTKYKPTAIEKNTKYFLTVSPVCGFFKSFVLTTEISCVTLDVDVESNCTCPIAFASMLYGNSSVAIKLTTFVTE